MERGGPAAALVERAARARKAQTTIPGTSHVMYRGSCASLAGFRSLRFGVTTCGDQIDFPFHFRLARSAIRRAQKLRYELGCFQRPATATAGTEHPLRSLIASVPTIKPRNDGYEDRSRHCVGP